MAKHHAVIANTATVHPVPVHTEIAEPSLIQNPETWILVAFLVFALLSLRYLLPMLIKALDARADKIRNQLEQASILRAQAEALLASYEAERESKKAEAQTILDDAKKDSAALRAHAETELNQLIERKTAQAIEKIARAELEAQSELRQQMVEVATHAVRQVMKDQLAQSGEDPTVFRSLAALEKQLH